MAQHEYKVLSGSPTGIRLMPYASEKLQEEVGPGSYERKLNQLAEDVSYCRKLCLKKD